MGPGYIFWYIHIWKIFTCIYIYMVTPSAAAPSPPKWSGKPPPSVVWVVVRLIGNPFSPVVWGLVGGLLLLLWCGVLWVGIPLPPPPVVWGLVGGKGFPSSPPAPPWCGVWWGRVRAGKCWWARGGREASLVRQTIFFGRRFCSETLGCPFKCFSQQPLAKEETEARRLFSMRGCAK